MATAQSLFVDQFVTLINGNPNLAARVIASSPHPGILRVTSKAADTPWITWISAASTVTGAGTFAAKAATGSPQQFWTGIIFRIGLVRLSRPRNGNKYAKFD